MESPLKKISEEELCALKSISLLTMPPTVVQEDEPKYTVFCVAAYTSAGLYHSHLLPFLPNVTFHILINPVLRGHKPPFATLKDLISFYAWIVRSIDPNGPYIICSYSFCCYHAVILSQLLMEENSNGSFLIMIDPLEPPEPNKPIYSSTNMVEDKLLLLVNHTPSDGSVADVKKINLAMDLSAQRFGKGNYQRWKCFLEEMGASSRLEEIGPRIQCGKYENFLSSTFWKALNPEGYYGQVLFLNCGESHVFDSMPPFLGHAVFEKWRDVCKGPVEVKTIEGAHHHNVMKKTESVRQIASIILDVFKSLFQFE